MFARYNKVFLNSLQHLRVSISIPNICDGNTLTLFSGFVAERVNLRYFLALGMILSGIASYLFGLARILDIHSLAYFMLVQIFGGVVQTSGWPGVVTVVGNWFGKNKRGKVLTFCILSSFVYLNYKNPFFFVYP